jgi:RNA polymerase sigma-70 factor (ECF subfamily)
MRFIRYNFRKFTKERFFLQQIHFPYVFKIERNKMTRQEITAFYQQHHRRVYNTAWRILRNSDDAEEVMQDTLIKYIGRKDGTPLTEEQTAAWLSRTCIRASIDRLRERKRRADFLELYAVDESEVEQPEVPLEGWEVSTVLKALEQLEEPYRLVLNLVLLEGLDYEEISAFTGKKETTLRSIYSRGRAQLIKRLGK